MNILKGNRHTDDRGSITYNNAFDASKVKRMYTIENHSTDFVRGWQAHQIEQRWFAAMKGSFEISVVQIDDFVHPSPNLEVFTFMLHSDTLQYLHVPAGCATAIKSREEHSKLLVLSDYALGEVEDDYRFSIDYFKKL